MPLLRNESPQAEEKTISALDTLIAPLQILFRRRGKERKQTRGIGAVKIYQFLRIDYIFFRLGHFLHPASFHGSAAMGTLPAFFLRAKEFSRKKPVMLNASVSLF